MYCYSTRYSLGPKCLSEDPPGSFEEVGRWDHSSLSANQLARIKY